MRCRRRNDSSACTLAKWAPKSSIRQKHHHRSQLIVESRGQIANVEELNLNTKQEEASSDQEKKNRNKNVFLKRPKEKFIWGKFYFFSSFFLLSILMETINLSWMKNNNKHNTNSREAASQPAMSSFSISSSGRRMNKRVELAFNWECTRVS